MELKSIYDTKIIVLELDFDFVQQYTLDESTILKKLLYTISACQHLVIITDNSLNQSLAYINGSGLKVGFLICSSGSITYDIAAKTVISDYPLPRAKSVEKIKYAFFRNLPFVMHTLSGKSYSFLLNEWIINKFPNLHNHLLQKKEVLRDWGSVEKALSLDIYSIGIHFFEKEQYVIKEHMENLGSLENLNKRAFYLSAQCKWEALKELSTSFSIVPDSILYLPLHQESESIKANALFTIGATKSGNRQTSAFSDTYISEEWYQWLYSNSYLWCSDSNKAIENIFKRINFLEGELLDDTLITKLYVSSKNRTVYLTRPNRDNTIQTFLFWPHMRSKLLEILNKKKVIN